MAEDLLALGGVHGGEADLVATEVAVGVLLQGLGERQLTGRVLGVLRHATEQAGDGGNCGSLHGGRLGAELLRELVDGKGIDDVVKSAHGLSSQVLADCKTSRSPVHGDTPTGPFPVNNTEKGPVSAVGRISGRSGASAVLPRFASWRDDPLHAA